MKWFCLCGLFLPLICVAKVDVCEDLGSERYFLSSWHDGVSGKVDILSWKEEEVLEVSKGRIVENIDLNGDEVGDFIFSSYDDRGATGQRTFDFLIQCKGYLRRVGGDDFADAEVLRTKYHGFRNILVYSYNRDESGVNRYEDGEALVKSHLWTFNPTTRKYEGEFD